MLLSVVLVGIFVAEAQVKTITGTVTSSEDGMGIPGVSVSVKGTTVGTVTNIDGQYQLNVPEDGRFLVFSFVGMKTKEAAIEGSIVNVALDPDVIGVEEVMVVGYGVTTKEAATGSVGSVDAEQIADVPEVTLDKLLSGKIAGVSITSESGQPGAANEVRIRGFSSINSGMDPLYVVDGVPIMSGDQSYFTNTGNALATINPTDIESITVLKDASAAAIYGSRAANGVIVITTKSGKAGQGKFNFKVSKGFDWLANDNNYGPMDAPDLLEWLRTAATNAGANPDEVYPMSLLDDGYVDWIDEMTRTGKIENYEFSVSGGNESTSHFISGSYTTNDGIFYGVGFDKAQIRANLDHDVNNWLKVGMRMNGGYTKSDDVAMQSLYYVNPVFAGMAIFPWTKIKNDDGTYNLDIPEWSSTNPLATAEYDDQWEKQHRMLTSMYFQIEPVKNLILKTNNSYEYTGGEGRRYWSAEADANGDATLQTSSSKYWQAITSNTANYSTVIDEDHSVQVLAGQEATKYYYNSYYISSPHVNPEIPFPTTATADEDDADYAETSFTLLSYFGILDYNYKGRYYGKVSVRRDGSSRFGENNRYGTFWAGAVAWNLHNEAFMDKYDWLNIFKIRASYGITGNDRIGNYTQYGTYGDVEFNGAPGMSPSRLANPDLTWEESKEYNLAIDYGFLDRFSGSLEFYERKTENMLYDKNISHTSGFTTYTLNIGSIKNTGVEFLLNYTAIKKRDLKWDLSLNLSHNKSEILDLGDEDQFIDSRFIYKVGENFYNYYLYDYAGVNPVNGEALWYTEDKEITNQANKANKIIAGSPEPKLMGGFNSNLYYKGFSLDLNLEFKTGNQVLIEEHHYLTGDGYWMKNQASLGLDYWKEPGDITDTPKPIMNNATNSSQYNSTRWMYDGDYLRIKNVTLSYTLPKKWVNTLLMSNLRVYASGVNLYTFHDVPFWDPERGSDGLAFGMYPQTKKLIFGVDITF